METPLSVLSSRPRFRSLRRRALFGSHFASLLAAGVFLLSTVGLGAFPPNPYYTIYGMVRDQVGATLRVEGAVLVLLANNTELGRAAVRPEPTGELNYELDLRIDQSRPTTRVYSDKALPSQGLYSLYVELNGERFYPIEVAGNLRAGNGGERVRLDLTLGVDANLDGLPDVWQEWQLYQTGRLPGGPGWNINLVTKTGDLDGDGISNWDEYVAGTFAGDDSERFELRLVGKSATAVAFDFYAITGKVYTIEESADLRTWTRTSLSTLPSAADAVPYYRATASGLQRGYVATAPGASRFYRLTVR